MWKYLCQHMAGAGLYIFFNIIVHFILSQNFNLTSRTQSKKMFFWRNGWMESSVVVSPILFYWVYYSWGCNIPCLFFISPGQCAGVQWPGRIASNPSRDWYRGGDRADKLARPLNSWTLSLDTRVPQLCINNIGKPYSAEVTHGHYGIYYVSLLTRCWYKLSLPVWVLVQMSSIHHIHWLQSQPAETAWSRKLESCKL